MKQQQNASEACQQWLERFANAWNHGPPIIADFIPNDLPSEAQRCVLLEMVSIDLEKRWESFASEQSATITESMGGSTLVAGLPRCPLLENYCRSIAGLGTAADLPLPLVLKEYQLRSRAGYAPSQPEYMRRFPQWSVELSRELSGFSGASQPTEPASKPSPLSTQRDSAMNVGQPVAPEASDRILETQIEPRSDPQQTQSLRTIHPWKHGSAKAADSSAPYRSTIALRPREVLFSGGDQLQAWDYEVGHLLGEGGMGSVFRARQGGIDRDVAVKMIRVRSHSGSAGPDSVAKFMSEAVMTGALEHPNVIPIYDLGLTSRGEPFYVMKEVRGKTWSKTIDSTSEEDNLDILLRVADAIGFAHARGIVHRDLKPDNVMLGEFGEVLVLDWGLFMPMPKFKNARIAHAEGLAGTPAYMAPEMACESPVGVGPLSDVYLLGALLFRCLVGKAPHSGRTVTECLRSARNNEFFATDRNDELMQIGRKAMSTRPEDRFQSVTEFQQAIKDYRSHAESYRLADFAQQELKTVLGERIEKTSPGEPEGVSPRMGLIVRGLTPSGSPDYRRFEKAVLALEQAVQLWDGNHAARESLVTARWEYANAAFARHDYELAEQQLDAHQPTHAELLPRIRLAKQERDARAVRLRRARSLAAGLAALVFVTVTVAAVWINRSRNEERIAKNEAVRRFQQSQEAIARITSISDQIQQLPRMQTVRKNMLEMVAGYYQELTDSPSQNPDLQLELARGLLRLGDVHRLLAEHRAAIAAWDQAMQFAKHLRATPLADQATDLIHQAQLRSAASLVAQHEFAEADHRLDVLLLELRRAGDSSRLEVAQTLYQRGLLHREQGQIDAAVKDLLESNLLYESLAASPEVVTDPRGFAATLSALGQLLQQRGEYSLASEKIRRACGIWSWQVIRDPSDTELREGYATSEIDLANTLRGLGREQSIEVLRSAIQSYERLVQARPEIPHYQFNLATARMNLANWLGRRGESDTAQKLASESVSGFIRLANDYHEDLRYPDREAEARIALAEILRDRHEVELAFDMLEEAGNHLNSQLAKNSSAPYREQIALAASLQAQLFVLQADAPAARELFQAAIAAWEALIQEAPAQAVRYQDSAAWTRFHFANHLASAGDLTAAKTHIDAAIRLREPLPINAVWDEAFAWLLLVSPIPELRDSQRALTLAQRAADAANDNPKFWRTVALAQLRNQRIDESQQTLKRAQDMGDDPTGETHFIASLLVAAQGESELARTRSDEGDALMQQAVPGSPRLRILQAEVSAALAK